MAKASEGQGAHDSPAHAGSTNSVPEALAGVVLGLHHVAIVVPSIEEARGAYETMGIRDALGKGVEHVPDQKVNVLVLFAGPQRIELVEPAADDSPVSNFIAKSGGRGGLHHVAFRVASVADAIAVLLERGVRLIHEEPQAGSHGTTIAFVHPKATGGVLAELVEDPHHPETCS